MKHEIKVAKASSSEKDEKKEKKEGEEGDEESKDDREAITTSVSEVTTVMPGLSDKEGRLVGEYSK